MSDALADELAWIAVPVALPEPGRTRGFTLDGEAFVLCNAQGTPFVLRDECSHAKTRLSGGRLCGFLLECPLHGGKIDVRDGSPAAPPVRRPVPTFPVRRSDGRIEVGLARPAAEKAHGGSRI
ncbi:MAG TPA: Rieske 2Fe-2S domain-containing protein [Candidatus Binatia bacterium]